MFAASKTAGAVSAEVNYIESCFSTYLYTGNGSTQTITNGIDLSTKGGLVWIKNRTTSARSHELNDTARGANYYLETNNTSAQQYLSTINWSFNTNGFSQNNAYVGYNVSGDNYVSWTFRKQPKFFDVVTFTTGATLSSNRSISHSLGSAPGFIVVKSSSNASNWLCYHRSLGQSSYVALQSTNAANTTSQWWTATAPTATTFNIDETLLLNADRTYVAYLFAHDAGGFGLTGTDNVISCGSYTGNGSTNGPVIDLGFEPQWILQKEVSNTGNWHILDVMRGMPVTGNTNLLLANTSAAEYTNLGLFIKPTATGFQIVTTDNDFNTNGSTHIYIAIRRGPMKVPTSGTSVFNIVSRTGTGAAATVTGVGFPVDLVFAKNQSQTTFYWDWLDRLRGPDRNLFSNATDAEYSNATVAYQSLTSFANMDGVVLGADGWNAYINGASNPYTNYFWRRAPGFFDEVCWTGTGSGSQAITHNLGVAPEFTITKRRSGTGNWSCFPVMFGVNTGIYLDSTAALQTNAALHPTLPTATTYYTNDASWGDENIGGTFVTYLFSTCAGVSKVGSYTGNGSTQTINCGFTGGARFVLIKRTDSTGDWYVYDTARGMTTLTDPYLLLNSTAAETATLGSVTTVTTGFAVNASILAAINTNGASYIFLAVS